MSTPATVSTNAPARAAEQEWSLFLHYPIATFAALGLLLGAVLLPLHGPASRIVFGLVALGGGLPLAWTTVKNMAQGRFYVDTVATLAIIGSLLTGEYLAGGMVVLMQAGGEALEDYGMRRANRSLDNLLKRAPSTAHRREGDAFVETPASQLEIGDVLLVRPGDILAADGIVMEGQGSVDEAALTGEPVPLVKQPGDSLFSGTINLTGSFLMQTTNTAAQSKYELIVRMVQQAQGERAPINRLANQYTPAFTLLTVVAALLAFLLTQNPTRAIAVLVVATPCPLIIATPLAVLSAINRAASLNILCKSGAAVEQASTIRTVVFDKTGTLTSGQPSLSEVRCFDGVQGHSGDIDALLEAVASVEMLSPHILARAVVDAAHKRQRKLQPATDVQEAPGTGIHGRVGVRRYVVGSGGFLRAHDVVISEAQSAERARLSADGKTIAYVAEDGVLVGMLLFEDRVRPEAPEAISRLQKIGITRLVMLTGDAPETAQAVAARVGIGDVRSRMHPEDKLSAIRELMQHGPVMMVGDGINDAPALATSNVGVAMGGYGAGIATDAADIVITVENVERVADAILIGRRMVHVAKQGIFVGMGVSMLLMVFAGLGFIAPAIGALLQEALDLATIVNALRAR